MIISSLKFSTHPRWGPLFGFTQLPSVLDAARLSIVASRNRHTFTVNFTFFREAFVPRTRDAHPRFTNAAPADHVVSSSNTACSVLLSASKMTKEILGSSSSADSRSILCLCQRQRRYTIYVLLYLFFVFARYCCFYNYTAVEAGNTQAIHMRNKVYSKIAKPMLFRRILVKNISFTKLAPSYPKLLHQRWRVLV